MTPLKCQPKPILKIAAEVVTDGFTTKIRIAQCADPANPGIPMDLWFGRGSTFDEVEHEIHYLGDLFRAREDLLARVTERLFRLLVEKLPGRDLLAEKHEASAWASNFIFTPKPKAPRNPHGWPFEISNGRAKLELKFSYSDHLAIYVDELRNEHELVSSRAGKWLVEL